MRGRGGVDDRKVEEGKGRLGEGRGGGPVTCLQARAAASIF